MFRLRDLIISDRQEQHIWDRHRVTPDEVDETCQTAHLVLRGRDGGHVIFGQTAAGRYLALFVYPRGADVYSLATARDMTDTERRRIRGLRPVDLYDDDDEET
jgi:hypothetical protein